MSVQDTYFVSPLWRYWPHPHRLAVAAALDLSNYQLGRSQQHFDLPLSLPRLDKLVLELRRSSLRPPFVSFH